MGLFEPTLIKASISTIDNIERLIPGLVKRFHNARLLPDSELTDNEIWILCEDDELEKNQTTSI